MLILKTEMVEKISVDKIKCDICEKEYNAKNYVESQEFQHIKFQCGYGSIFGDGSIVECDICQNCLNEKLGKFLRINEND